MLSQTVEYALRAAVQLASLAPESTTTAALAEVTQVPPAYLVKVLQALVKAGIVKSQRGVSGGVSLAIPANRLTILDIVNAADPIQRRRRDLAAPKREAHLARRAVRRRTRALLRHARSQRRAGRKRPRRARPRSCACVQLASLSPAETRRRASPGDASGRVAASPTPADPRDRIARTSRTASRADSNRRPRSRAE